VGRPSIGLLQDLVAPAGSGPLGGTADSRRRTARRTGPAGKPLCAIGIAPAGLRFAGRGRGPFRRSPGGRRDIAGDRLPAVRAGPAARGEEHEEINRDGRHEPEHVLDLLLTVYTCGAGASRRRPTRSRRLEQPVLRFVAENPGACSEPLSAAVPSLSILTPRWISRFPPRHGRLCSRQQHFPVDNLCEKR
jgi:hypothetical protein